MVEEEEEEAEADKRSHQMSISAVLRTLGPPGGSGAGPRGGHGVEGGLQEASVDLTIALLLGERLVSEPQTGKHSNATTYVSLSPSL